MNYPGAEGAGCFTGAKTCVASVWPPSVLLRRSSAPSRYQVSGAVRVRRAQCGLHEVGHRHPDAVLLTADCSRIHAGFRRDDPRRDTIELAAPIGRMVSPLSLTPRVLMQGRFIYAGIADQLVHPRTQTLRLWEHWGKPEVVWYPGGHAGFFRSRPSHRDAAGAAGQWAPVSQEPTAIFIR